MSPITLPLSLSRHSNGPGYKNAGRRSSNKIAADFTGPESATWNLDEHKLKTKHENL
ncbi:hypothetical protein O9K51_11208 [Purpureocillium lavendulum]|uniref:Uncharacterized protein n=1 Tax=Purpureocillium lavendulum TaxID=1247861 RepID=A0AB34FAQ6_9HYPO|nr:hypothetical protein O9K51_11208 [Purpureocillium lavendulum]